jgi:hypothetical protein
MSVEDPTDPVSKAGHRPVQFSLPAKLALTAMAGVAAAVLFAVPKYYAFPIIIFLTIALPPLLATVLVYGNRWQRSFCLGAIFPAGIMLWCTLSTFVWYFDVHFETWAEFYESLVYQYSLYRVYAGVSWVLSITIGLFTLALCRALTR